jgi:hypothetical protein
MTSHTERARAPHSDYRLYIGLASGSSRRWHTAGNPEAGRTDCGIFLPDPSRAKAYAVPPAEVALDAVCRRCATRWLDLALALGLVKP